jgi:hypothetical protein
MYFIIMQQLLLREKKVARCFSDPDNSLEVDDLSDDLKAIYTFFKLTSLYFYINYCHLSCLQGMNGFLNSGIIYKAVQLTVIHLPLPPVNSVTRNLCVFFPRESFIPYSPYSLHSWQMLPQGWSLTIVKTGEAMKCPIKHRSPYHTKRYLRPIFHRIQNAGVLYLLRDFISDVVGTVTQLGTSSQSP